MQSENQKIKDPIVVLDRNVCTLAPSSFSPPSRDANMELSCLHSPVAALVVALDDPVFESSKAPGSEGFHQEKLE